MTKFNKGDKVRFTDKSNEAWYGVEGIVEKAATGPYGGNTVTLTKAATGWAFNYKVGDEARLGDQYLELVEDTFTFNDIQVGDTIRRTQKHGEATDTREGVVGRIGSWYAETKDGSFILAYDTDNADAESVTLELVNRPEPEPTLLEGTKAGDQLVLKLHNGAVKVHTRNAKDQWDTLVFRNGDYSHTGFTWDTADLEGEATQAASHNLIKR